MVQFVFTNLLMISLGTVLYLLVRALPRVGEDRAEGSTILDRWAHSEIPEKVDAALNAFLEKFLRRLKIILLKIDNALASHLKRVKPANGNGKQQIDFKEMAAEKNAAASNGSPADSPTEVKDIT